MKRNLVIRIVLVLVVVLVLGCLSLAIFSPREPRYQGRTLSKWIEYAAINRGSDPEWQAAAHAVRRMAPDALPWLLKWAQAMDSPPKAKLVEWLDSHPSLHIHIRGMEYYTSIAYLGFQILGKEAKPARPVLIQWTYDTAWNRRCMGLMCLQASEPEKETLLPVLLRLIHDQNKDIQGQASYELYHRFPKEAEAAGMIKTFPELNSSPTNQPTQVQPPANK